MRRILVAGVAVVGAIVVRAGDGVPAARWTMESVEDGRLQDAHGGYHGRIHGTIRAAPGVEGGALAFDGSTTLAAVPAAPELSIGRGPFTVAAWVNTYAPAGAQRMIAAKNDYQAGRREWGLMLDSDGQFRFYARGEGWKTVSGTTVPKPGEWHHVAVTVEGGRGRLYVDGMLEGEGDVPAEVAATEAPLTLGGVRSGGGLTQTFHGALDEVALYRVALAPAAIAALADRRPAPHKIEIPHPVQLWAGTALPKAADLPLLPGVGFRVIKPYEVDMDGYHFLHGVALVWHKRRLYASFGHNKGGENTDTEEARVRVSDDGGATWGPVTTIDAGEEPGVGVSHGVFLSHAGRLWTFHGAYTGIMQGVHARAYVLNEADGSWERKGTVVGDGFWPLGEPVRMEDGNWIMAGARVGDGNPAAVAISHGDDFTKWDLVAIPKPAELKMWGESGVIVDGRRVPNIARCDGRQPVALVAVSEDFGRTWTASRPSNLPMAASKPCTGTLSTGQRFLICSTTADGGSRRAPLTIALTRPGETNFSSVRVIRHAILSADPARGSGAPAASPVESHERASLAYPCAVEHDGKLYVGYSNSGGGVGRKGTGRELWNNNSAEMAVIPVASLAGDAAAGADHALLDALVSPVLFRGDEHTGYRDPLLLRHDGVFHMFFTVGERATNAVYLHLAKSTSRDMKTWTPVRKLTPGDLNLNFVSPGSVVRHNGEWLLCASTYPQPAGELYGNSTARLYLMRSPDLERWSEPELIRVKGPEVPVAAMGRMIDAYLMPDKDDAGKWWCFFKQNGVSMSWSRDLRTWTFAGSAKAGENVCVLVKDGRYLMFHSPHNGIGVMESADLRTWAEAGPLLTLGQAVWPWARGRITAGYVADLRDAPGVGRYLMVFHGTGPEPEPVKFLTHGCLGIAWSDDLKTWRWPGAK